MNDQKQLQSEQRDDCVNISRNCWDLKINSESVFYNKISLLIDLFLFFWILEKIYAFFWRLYWLLLAY